jgi:hypothetical protein
MHGYDSTTEARIAEGGGVSGGRVSAVGGPGAVGCAAVRGSGGGVAVGAAAGWRDVLDPARLARINNGMRFVPVANALADQVERAAKAWDEFDTLFCLAANREGGDAA